MPTFLLVMFLLTPDGNISAQAHKEIIIGADLCLAMKAVQEERLKTKQNVLKYSVECVDTKLKPGVPA